MNVAIIGKAPSSRLLAPYNDPTFECWSLSDNYTVTPNWHRWFELHDLTRYAEHYPDYYKWMTELPGPGDDGYRPLYVAELRPELKAAVMFPYRALCAEFETTYFTNSVSWMTALAISEMKQQPGPHQLHFYGVDMAQDTEYASQRPSCEYFIGIAAGLGIRVHVPPESDILKCARLYAIETNRGQMDRKIRVRDVELAQRQVQHESERNEAEAAKYVAAGGLQMLKEVAQLDGQLTHAWLHNREKELQVDLNMAKHMEQEAIRKVYMLMGARENLRWSQQWA